MSSDIAISLKGVCKKYRYYESPRDRLRQVLFGWHKNYFNESPALDNIQLDIFKRETIGIIGRNGSGKSTLLQIICDVIKPTAGDVCYFGRIAALLELGSGFNPDYNGIENIKLYGAILGLSRKEIDSKIEDIVAFSEIEDFIYKPIKTYSSGMVVRLAFSVIAHVDADILVIDEALSVGDAFFVQKCMRFLRSFMEKGTVIFVSHDTGAVLNLCDRAVFLENGVIKAVGDTEEVVRQYLEQKFNDQQSSDEENTSEEESITEYEVEEKSVLIEERYDMRREFYNSIELRNDLMLEEPTNINELKQFGEGGVKITSSYIEDLKGNRLAWIVGGEYIKLIVKVEALTTLLQPLIIGFSFKDKLGQHLFADNTFLKYLNTPVKIKKGEVAKASFIFQTPRLPSGQYAVDVAVAEGDQDSHVMHHWLYDAFVIESQCKSAVSGLVGIPMDVIKLEVEERE